MSIEVNQVSKLYGEQKALDGVSFSISKGEIVGFLGPNGAGKSTMMKIISCYLPQTTGTVSVCGYDVAEQAIEVRKNLGYLPEHNPLYHDMYVKEYLAFIAGLHKVSHKAIDEVIEETGLGPEKHKKIAALSKGYRQRVGIAQALIHKPRVLILDEPTSGLDPNQLADIRSLIKRAGKEKTVMLSTHIMQEVEALCDRVIIINKGQIIADKNIEALQSISTNRHLFTLAFDKEVSQAALEAVAGVAGCSLLNDNKWQIIAVDGEDPRPALFQFAVTQGLTILHIQQEEQGLEDIFRSLTEH